MYLIVYFIIGGAFIIGIIIFACVSSYLSKKRLQEIVEELHLVQGAHYNVTTRNGKRQLDLIYDRISYGNKSKNGNINIYFTKNFREVMIKYDTISNVERAETTVKVTIKKVTDTKSDIKSNTYNNDIDECNANNAYHDQIFDIQQTAYDKFDNITAREIYDYANKMIDLPRPTSYCFIHLHYGLISLINLIYKLRDRDEEAIDYCINMCDIDIYLYDDIYKEIKNDPHPFIYDGSLTRKLIILEKQGDYAAAIELCDWALNTHYFNTEQLDNLKARKAKLENKANRTKYNKTIVD